MSVLCMRQYYRAVVCTYQVCVSFMGLVCGPVEGVSIFQGRFMYVLSVCEYYICVCQYYICVHIKYVSVLQGLFKFM